MPKNTESLESAFELVAKLLELHDDNPFKIKSFTSAARAIDGLGPQAETLTEEEWKTVPGIGASHLKRIQSFKSTGTFSELEEMLDLTPQGVLEMLSIRGLGAKKVRILWKSLGIETLTELIYACEENRLVQLKGFGEKTQQSVKATAEFVLMSRGKMRLDKAEKTLKELQEVAPKLKFFPVGEYRRFMPVVEKLQVVLDEASNNRTIWPHQVQEHDFGFTWISSAGVSVDAFLYDTDSPGYQMINLTGPSAYVQQFQRSPSLGERAFYDSLGKPWLSPELRDHFEKFEQGDPDNLVNETGFYGALHNHTDWSDGHHTLEQMADAAMQLGWRWLGIADHSQSAFYAQGLSEERLLAQFKQIDLLNEKLSGKLRLVKGVESDILSDGSLDYPDEILAQCDYVVASVHSGLRMEEEKAMQRLLKAIEHPYTTILGHPTGRLLLGREGYPLNMERILQACADNQVAVEINAHPYRLDLDWQYVGIAQAMGVKIIINPDAHQQVGLQDVRFGIGIARKGGLQKLNCLNYWTETDLFDWLSKRK